MTSLTMPRAAAPPHASRRTARIVGWLFVATYVTAISAKWIFYPPLFDGNYIVSGGADSRVLWGAFCELLLVIANLATAVVLFPLLKRHDEGLALGFVAARLIECVFICVGILSVLTIVTMQRDMPADTAGLATVGHALMTVQQWTFNLGPGLAVGVGNGLILSYLMYSSGLVPRGLTVLGLVGGAGICISGVAVVLGLTNNGSPVQLAASIPEFVWELSLGIYLITKGFKTSHNAPGPAPATR
jgi:hypothetical protein